jgi:hypothetical protein
MLFIDYSSAFNTIVPSKLIIKLWDLGLNSALYNWVLNTGAPQGYLLSPLLFSLFSHDCVATHASNSIIKFADDTTVVDLITNNDETAYREGVMPWECSARKITSHSTSTKQRR